MRKILVIEDDPALQEMYKTKFTKEGFASQAAGTGKAGIELMKSFDPDIVLLDLMLPDMTGFSVIEIIKKDPQINTIPVVVMTNIYADAEDLIKNHGVKSFILKSNVNIKDVVSKIKNILEEKLSQ